MEWLLYLGGPGWLQSPPLFGYSSILRGTGWDKKGIKFWIERLIINLAGKLGFNPHSCFNIPQTFERVGDYCSDYFLLKQGTVLSQFGEWTQSWKYS